MGGLSIAEDLAAVMRKAVVKLRVPSSKRGKARTHAIFEDELENLHPHFLFLVALTRDLFRSFLHCDSCHRFQEVVHGRLDVFPGLRLGVIRDKG